MPGRVRARATCHRIPIELASFSFTLQSCPHEKVLSNGLQAAFQNSRPLPDECLQRVPTFSDHVHQLILQHKNRRKVHFSAPVSAGRGVIFSTYPPDGDNFSCHLSPINSFRFSEEFQVPGSTLHPLQTPQRSSHLGTPTRTPSDRCGIHRLPCRSVLTDQEFGDSRHWKA